MYVSQHDNYCIGSIKKDGTYYNHFPPFDLFDHKSILNISDQDNGL